MNTELHNQIIDAIAESNRVAVAADKVKTRQGGIYAQFTMLAASNGRSTFEKAVDEVFVAIRTNADDLAKKTKCAKGKKEGTYTIPSAASSAKSVLCAAYEHAVDMVDAETNEPRPFTKIREDVKQAREVAREADRTPEQEVRDNAAAHLEELAKALRITTEVSEAEADLMAALSVHLDTWSEQYIDAEGASDDAEVAEAA